MSAGGMNDLTLRDYFAAHAPDEIPDWFRPDEAPVPSPLWFWTAARAIPSFVSLPDELKEQIRGWFMDPCYDMGDELIQIGKAIQAAVREREEQREEAIANNCANRYYAWRWAYADSMLRTRGD